MPKNYLTDKAQKKKYALKGAWLIIILAVIFIIVVVKFALSGYDLGLSDSLPGSDEAYIVAKDFIRPTIKYPGISFPASGYQCATKPDSVYILRSYVEAKDQPKEKSIVTFEITMKFNGGKATDKKNWTVLHIMEN